MKQCLNIVREALRFLFWIGFLLYPAVSFAQVAPHSTPIVQGISGGSVTVLPNGNITISGATFGPNTRIVTPGTITILNGGSVNPGIISNLPIANCGACITVSPQHFQVIQTGTLQIPVVPLQLPQVVSLMPISISNGVPISTSNFTVTPGANVPAVQLPQVVSSVPISIPNVAPISTSNFTVTPGANVPALPFASLVPLLSQETQGTLAQHPILDDRRAQSMVNQVPSIATNPFLGEALKSAASLVQNKDGTFAFGDAGMIQSPLGIPTTVKPAVPNFPSVELNGKTTLEYTSQEISTRK